MFLPGQKVACVNDKFPEWVKQYFPKLPVKDNIYTIRDIVPGTTNGKMEGELAVYLEEIQGTINDFGIERGFNAERFAPLQEYKVEELEKITKPEEVFV